MLGCAEITISGSGTAYPAGVSIPGAYQNTDPGIYVSIYYEMQMERKGGEEGSRKKIKRKDFFDAKKAFTIA